MLDEKKKAFFNRLGPSCWQYCKCWSNDLCPFLCPIFDVCDAPPTTCSASLCCGFPDKSEVEEVGRAFSLTFSHSTHMSLFLYIHKSFLRVSQYCKCWANDLCPFKCPIFDVCPPPSTTCPASLCCGFPDKSEVEDVRRACSIFTLVIAVADVHQLVDMIFRVYTHCPPPFFPTPFLLFNIEKAHFPLFLFSLNALNTCDSTASAGRTTFAPSCARSTTSAKQLQSSHPSHCLKDWSAFPLFFFFSLSLSVFFPPLFST